MKYTIVVDDKSKAGSIIVELAKIFSKLYKSISIVTNNSLKGQSSVMDDVEEALLEIKNRKPNTKTKTLKELVNEK